MTQQHQISLLQERDTTRLEAFSDGVFAIAITLLMLFYLLPALSLPAPEKLYRADTADQHQPEVKEIPS